MFLLNTEMVVALRRWTHLNTTECCPWLLTPREKDSSAGSYNKIPSAMPRHSALYWEMPQRNAAMATLLYRVGIRRKRLHFLSFWGLPRHQWLGDTIKRHFVLPSSGLPGAVSGISSFWHSVTQTPLAAFEAQGTACVWPDIELCSAGQRLLESQHIQAGWIRPRILSAGEIKLMHVVLIKNFNVGRFVSVSVFWEPH